MSGPVAEGVDGGVLRSLMGEIGLEVATELVDLFAEDGPVRVDAIEMAWGEGDLDGTSQAAHSLKGSALNLGAQELAELAATIEKSKDRDTLADLIPSVRPALQRAVAGLRAVLG